LNSLHMFGKICYQLEKIEKQKKKWIIILNKLVS
jgi:hypothetical protein